jgi:hypothetical protein
MSTRKQKLVLRSIANAKQSAGSKEAGKTNSYLSFVPSLLLPPEHAAALEKFQRKYFNEFQPEGIIEFQLTHTLANTAWALHQAAGFESKLFNIGRLVNSHLIETPDARSLRAMLAFKVAAKQVQNLEKFGVYQQRKLKMYSQAMATLRKIQAARRAENPTP